MTEADKVVQLSVFQADPAQRVRVPGGGSSGGFDGMEPRIARLEADVEYIKRDLSEARLDIRALRDGSAATIERLARIEERLQHMPTKAGLIWGGLTVIGAIVGAMGLLLRYFGR